MPSVHPLALVCTGVLAVLLFGLGLAVSGARLRSRRLVGITDDPDALLNRLVRAHGNTSEYAPTLAVLFVLLGWIAPTTAALAAMVGATACRLLFVVGMLSARTLTRPNPVRFVGALGTYVFGLWLAVLLLMGI